MISQPLTPPSGKKIPVSSWRVVIILSSVATMVCMLSYANTTIPVLIKDFNITYIRHLWILTTYLITGAVMTPIAGKLSDIYGKKKILLIIMLFYTTGSIGANPFMVKNWYKRTPARCTSVLEDTFPT